MRESIHIARRFALAVVLGGVFAAAAQAGTAYTGRFTLPYEVLWGRAVLPAGEYSLSMDSIQGPLDVIDASGRVRARVFGFPDSPAKGQTTALLVTRDGAQRTVRSFNCPLWGHKFVYKPFTPAEREMIANGERAETIAVRKASR